MLSSPRRCHLTEEEASLAVGVLKMPLVVRLGKEGVIAAEEWGPPVSCEERWEIRQRGQREQSGGHARSGKVGR